MIESKESMEEIVQHQAWLKRLARSVVSESDADDLVQEVYLKVAHKPPALRSSSKAWLASVLRNAARMRHRSDTRRKQRDSKAVMHEGAAPLTCEQVAQKQSEYALQTMVASLPPMYRDTIIALYVDGLSAVEFAGKSSLNPATVRQRHREGLRLLRAKAQKPKAGALAQLRAWCLAFVPAAATEMSSPLALELYEFGLIAL